MSVQATSLHPQPAQAPSRTATVPREHWAWCRRTVLALVAAAFVNASCGSEREPTSRPGPSPATWVEALQVCADGPTVPGIDVSKWQGAIDWEAVQDSGVVFAFIRVSHGTEILDEYFVDNWTEAEAAGVLRGAYQYFSPSQDPIAQADLLLDRLATHGAGELPPVIDVEETDGQSAAALATRVGQWLSRVESELGVRPVIYTGSYFWNDNVQTTDYAGYPLWIAHWGVSCPNLPTAWSDWVFWQTSSTGSVPGIMTGVDTDVFNGDLEALLAFGTDPECRADSTFRDCIGDVLRQCDESGRLISTDCAAGGEVCSLVGGIAHCADADCATYLDGGETGTFCFDDRRLGECIDGQLSEVDCAASGTICESDGSSAQCVEPTIVEPAPDAGIDPPDAGGPPIDDVGPDGDAATGGPDAGSTPAPPGFTRFAQVPESGLDGGLCQVGGRVGSSGWLGLLLTLVGVWARRRAPAS